MKPPIDLDYGLDARPPPSVMLLSGLQHVGLIGIILVFPLVLAREAGLAAAPTLGLISITMLVLGAGAILQGLRGPVGSGYLCPPVCTAMYLSPALLAAKAGGMPLVMGMLVFSGLVESLLSRVLHPMRPYLPPELSGLVVLLIGVNLGNLALRYLLGHDGAATASAGEWTVALVTLGTMVGLSVWGRGAPRLFCALLGMVVGYALSWTLGLVTPADLEALDRTPLVALPVMAHQGWSWDAALAMPFLVAALGTAIRGMGDVTIAQKINDAQWVRPDMGSISGGVLANGLTNVLAGLLGAHAVSTNTSSVGLSVATGVTARRVTWAIGGLFIVLAFFPKVAAVFLVLPRPVIGAAILFTAAIVFVNGLQIVASRLLDARRTYVVGLSFLAGLAVDLYPATFQGSSFALAPLFASSLVLGTSVALVLNFIARFGIWRTQHLEVDPQEPQAERITAFMSRHGAAWGARREVIDRATYNLAQSVETIVQTFEPAEPLAIEAHFDEFNLDVRVSYAGPALELPQVRPSLDEVMESPEGERRLAGYMIRRLADRVEVTHEQGRTTLLFHFDH